MPHIPLIVDNKKLNPDGTFTKTFGAYNKDNYLDNYVRRAGTVINYLSKCPWVTSDELLLFGHSQGCYVALKLAQLHSEISKIGLTSMSPNGRYEQYLRSIRHKEHMGELNSQEAQVKIEEYYNRWNHITQNRNDDSQSRGDTFKATYSFSENFMDDLIALEIPIYIAYGTHDIGALGCDAIPLEFAKINKTNYLLKAYPGLGHNFEEINEAGQSDYDNMHWDEVFQQFIRWSFDAE